MKPLRRLPRLFRYVCVYYRQFLFRSFWECFLLIIFHPLLFTPIFLLFGLFFKKRHFPFHIFFFQKSENEPKNESFYRFCAFSHPIFTTYFKSEARMSRVNSVAFFSLLIFQIYYEE